MLFTKASEYALLSMVVIADKGETADVDTIASELNISRSFLAKILQNLVKADLLNSFKGAKGGFVLAKDAANITLAEIVNAAERRKTTVFECVVDDFSCPKSRKGICCINRLFIALQGKVDEYLQTMTLKDLASEDIK